MITWLLDVDGVLNINKSPWHEAPQTGTAYAQGMNFRMRYCPSLIKAIRSMSKEFHINMIWATSWANHINQIENCMNLPKWTVMPYEEGSLAFDAKIQVALEYQDLGHNLIWTDDHAPWMGTLADGKFRNRGHLLIAPDERYGLTPEDIDRIKEYANQHGKTND